MTSCSISGGNRFFPSRESAFTEQPRSSHAEEPAFLSVIFFRRTQALSRCRRCAAGVNISEQKQNNREMPMRRCWNQVQCGGVNSCSSFCSQCGLSFCALVLAPSLATRPPNILCSFRCQHSDFDRGSESDSGSSCGVRFAVPLSRVHLISCF